MPAPKLRIDHPGLDHAAQQFSQQADAVRESLRQLQSLVDALRAGDWVGVGANEFFREMDQEVSPSLKRLANALEAAGKTIRKIVRLMIQTEEDVARLFDMEGATGTVAAAGLVEAEIAGAAEGVLPGPGAGFFSSGARRTVRVTPGPGDTEVVSISVRDPSTGVWLSLTPFTRPRPADARERKVQALIDKALSDPKPENYQAAVDEAVKLYDIDASYAVGKPTFDPRVLPPVLGVTGTITQEVRIGEGAFASPGKLASTIRHETFHAEYAQDYWYVDDPQSRTLMHVHVYDRQLAYAEQDHLRQSQVDDIQKMRALYYDALTPSNQKQVDAGIYTIPR